MAKTFCLRLPSPPHLMVFTKHNPHTYVYRNIIGYRVKTTSRFMSLSSRPVPVIAHSQSLASSGTQTPRKRSVCDGQDRQTFYRCILAFPSRVELRSKEWGMCILIVCDVFYRPGTKFKVKKKQSNS